MKKKLDKKVGKLENFKNQNFFVMVTDWTSVTVGCSIIHQPLSTAIYTTAAASTAPPPTTTKNRYVLIYRLILLQNSVVKAK